MEAYVNGKYIFYFDSGTTNTRAYLLSSDFEILCIRKKSLGSKDSAIAGNNTVLIDGLWELYRETIGEFQIKDGDISDIYASGMVTSPYGLQEIPHINVPVRVEEFSESVYSFREDTRFHRIIKLVPGLKRVKADFSFSGNMRGEEIEMFGALDELEENGLANVALIMPGSHTHIALIRNGTVEDIISTFTGELFHALKKETVLSPILEGAPPELDSQMVKVAYRNLLRFGFNRGIYIAHAMRMLGGYASAQIYSYCEGAVNGGVRQVLEYYCQEFWPNCGDAAIVSDEFMYKLFAAIFEDSWYIKRLFWLPTDYGEVYSVKGLKKILTVNRGR